MVKTIEDTTVKIRPLIPPNKMSHKSVVVSHQLTN